jgi:SAM-dependent methyltransferase
VADRIADPATIETIRALLEQANYSEEGIAAIGIDVGLGVRRPDVPILLDALEPVEPLATLVRLFLLMEPVSQSQLEDVVGSRGQALVDPGFVRIQDGQVIPLLSLTPWRGFVVAHDPDPPGDLWADHVSGPTPAADTLLQLVKPVGNAALDLGTGCGLLAMAIAGDVDSVVATDINPAALRFARLNAHLNDLSNIEAREGNLFEPVDPESFQTIMSNPPFVISPESEVVFRQSPYGRDEISREVTQGIAGHLDEGGFGYLLANWIVGESPESWLDVPRSWVKNRGCDLVVLLQGIDDPLAYAARWNLREQYVRPARYSETLRAWLAHDAAEGISAIASGALVLRRRPGRNWVHGLKLAGPAGADAAAQIQRIVAGRDLLAEVEESALPHLALQIPGPHRLDQSLVARDGEYSIEPARLIVEEGLALELTIDPELIPAVLRLDGTQRLSEIVAEISSVTGQDTTDLTSRVVDLGRRLLETGVAVSVTQDP